MPKWAALGAVADKSLADVDPDTIDNIYDEAELGIPPKGPYLFNLKRLQGTESKAGDPMLKMVLELAEPKGTKKAKYNGYSIWYYQVSTKERASGVNGLLHVLLDGKTPAQRKKVVESYWAGNVVVDDDGFVKKIGTWTVPDSVLIGANTRHENDAQYGERLAVAFNGIMPASDRPASKVADADEDVDEPDEDEVDEDAADEDDEVAARQEELEALTLAKLKAAAKELGITVKRGATAEDIIESILDVELPEDAEEEDEDEPEEEEEEDAEEEDEEPEGDEFDEMDRAALKKFNTTEKLGIKVTTKMTDDDLRDAIRAALPDDAEEPEEEEAEEEEPEPTPAPRRGRAKATAAAPGRAAAKRRKGSDDEPPF